MTKVEAAELNTIQMSRVADYRPTMNALTTVGDIPFRRPPINCPPIRTVPIRRFPEVAEPNISAPGGSPPMAVGLIRPTMSVRAATLHALALPRHARSLGYRYGYTVRPPENAADPIGYALRIAAWLTAAAIVVYDLTAVDDQPARVCESFDLETVCPPTTWARVAESSIGTNSAVAEENRP